MSAHLESVVERIRNFRDDRDWMQFHNPKNLACSLSIEAAELLEIFQWLDMEKSEEAAAEKIDRVSEEIADVAIYLLELADNLGIDLLECIERKLDRNDAKYPVDKAKGNAKKYTEI